MRFAARITPVRKVLIRVAHGAPGIRAIVAVNLRHTERLQPLPRKPGKIRQILARRSGHKESTCPALTSFKRKLDLSTNLKGRRPDAWPQPGHDF